MKRYHVIDFFLDTPLAEALLQYAIDQEPQYQKSGVIGDPSWRSSKLMFWFGPFDREFKERVRLMAPAMMRHLGIPPIEIRSIEAQLTAHNDGHYFKRHLDNGSPETNARVLTYVYYFFREPRGFEGGEIEIDGDVLEVRNNSILFFSPSTWHEVRPVRCASRQWADSRFTINGWVRKANV